MRLLICLLLNVDWALSTPDDAGVELPSDCEVCKYVALELEAALQESAKTHSVIETAKGKVKAYRDSELRLLETLEGLCERFSDYSVHKERKGSARFGRGQSETMQTLHSLVEKGVKVDLGIPYELWDSPSVEVAELKSRCEWVLGDLEDDIEEWFTDHQTDSLIDYLCKDRLLRGKDQSCLSEEPSRTPSQSKGDRSELMEARTSGKLRPRKCELGHLYRANGSAAYAQGETVVWASVFGPGDLRMSRQDSRKAIVSVSVRAKVLPHLKGETVVWASVFGPGDLRMSRQDSRKAIVSVSVRAKSGTALGCGKGRWGGSGNLEAWIRDAVSATLLVSQFPRAEFSIAIQQMQDDGGLYSSAVNAACLCLLDAGVPMRGIFCGITVGVRSHSQELVVDPLRDEEDSMSALLHFIFTTGLDLESEQSRQQLASIRTQGSFHADLLPKAVELGGASAKLVFAFFRLAMEAKYCFEENTVQSSD